MRGARSQSTPDGDVYALPSLTEPALRPQRADSTHAVAFRIQLPEDARAVRLHFAGFRLPPGARVYVYPPDKSLVAGPYQRSGILQSGEFWSEAVPGDSAVVELQSPTAFAALPFTVTAAAAAGADQEMEIQPSADDSVPSAVSWIQGAPTRHSVSSGWAVWEGDILLAPMSRLLDASKEPVPPPRAAAAVVTPWNLWPGGIVPYSIHPQLSNTARVTAAIAHWNTHLAGWLRFVPRTTESAYITFQPAEPTMCASYIGRTGTPAQPIFTGSYCTTGILIHEIGHAIGLFHEHTRRDRDRFVEIRPENIDPISAYNFDIAANSDSIGDYDFSSIMHYGAYSFSINGRPTIVTIPAGIAIGQRSGLSAGDLAAIKALYPRASTTTTTPAISTSLTTVGAVAVTLASNPTGQLLLIDGSAVTTPHTAAWPPGSVHTISAPHHASDEQMAVFSRWSDNGAQTHSFTTPYASAHTLEATFAVRHRLRTQVTPPNAGELRIEPASSDSHYAASDTVQATAVAAPGFCFTGWSGVIPVAESTISLTMTRPYNLTASFQPGSVSIPAVLQVPAYAHTASLPVAIRTGCIWRATSDSDWITVPDVAALSPASLPVTVSANPSPSPRFGRVRILGQWTTILQDGRP